MVFGQICQKNSFFYVFGLNMSFFILIWKMDWLQIVFVKDDISGKSFFTETFFIAFFICKYFIYNYLRVFYKISQEESYYFHIGVPYFPMGMIVFS